MSLAAFTLDLDLTDYVGGGRADDELESFWPVFKECCRRFPSVKTTWFIRIDEHMEAVYGSADYVFAKHADKVAWLHENGHETGWHFHSYRRDSGRWVQNSDAADVAAELERMSHIAFEQGLDILRMGWAYHNNTTMAAAAALGLKFDSSAFPRPRYSWDNPLRDWSRCGQIPYYPSVADYQVPGNPCYGLLQVPMSTMEVPVETDTDHKVRRYLNPAYRHRIFQQAFEMRQQQNVNMVCHPYEFLNNVKAHSLISFDAETLYRNMQWLLEGGVEPVTLSRWVAHEADAGSADEMKN